LDEAGCRAAAVSQRVSRDARDAASADETKVLQDQANIPALNMAMVTLRKRLHL